MKSFTSEQINPKPLEGMTVVAIADHVSGPIAASLLALQGATVFKIEPVNGDPARSYLHPAIFDQINRGLLSVEIHESFYLDLLSIADVIIDNRSPSAKNKDIFLKQALNRINKPTIYCSISGFGDEFDIPSMDVNVQSESGAGYSNADERGQPLKVGFALADINSGRTAASQIITTWLGLKLHPDHYRNKLIKLEISLFAEMLYQQFGQVIQSALNLQQGSPDQIRKGNQDMFLSPFSFYQTKDEKYIAIAVGNPSHFSRLCNVVNKNEWLELYPNNQDRLASKKFNDEFIETIKEKSAEEWIRLLRSNKIPCSPVNTVREAIQQIYATPYLLKHQSTPYPVVTTPCRNSANVVPIETTLRAPKLNEHYELAILHIEEYNRTNTVRARL